MMPSFSGAHKSFEQINFFHEFFSEPYQINVLRDGISSKFSCDDGWAAPSPRKVFGCSWMKRKACPF